MTFLRQVLSFPG